MVTKQDLQRIEKDKEYWMELAAYIDGWELMGWTDRRGATYITPGHFGDYHNDTIQFTGRQRDDLITAFKHLKEDYYDQGQQDAKFESTDQ